MRTKILTLLGGIIISSFFLSGCANTGIHASTHMTQVELSQGNYSVVATSVKGEASAQYILGFSFGVGFYTQTFALIPISKERALYQLAMQNLWKNFEEKNGSPIGRKLALVNTRYDAEALNLFVYTSPKVTLVADVVAFTN